jgi:hypothetical protein
MLKGINNQTQKIEVNKTQEGSDSKMATNESPVMTTQNTRPKLSEEQIAQILSEHGQQPRKPRPFSQDYEGSLSDPIVAIPMEQLSVEKVTCKNPAFMARWVHNKSEGIGVGVRFWEGKGIGARLATVDDVEVAGLSSKDGHFYWGELVLMVIPKELYAAALKAKDQRAFAAVSPQARLQRQNAVAKDSLTNTLVGKDAITGKEIHSDPKIDTPIEGETKRGESHMSIAMNVNKGLTSYLPDLDESKRAGL